MLYTDCAFTKSSFANWQDNDVEFSHPGSKLTKLSHISTFSVKIYFVSTSYLLEKVFVYLNLVL